MGHKLLIPGGEHNQQLSKQELYKYAQQAFQVDQETHEKFMEEVKEEKVIKSIFYNSNMENSSTIIISTIGFHILGKQNSKFWWMNFYWNNSRIK